MQNQIPKEVKQIAKGLRGAGFEAYMVGGCVRDLIINKEPADWDIATNATPKDIQKIFPDSVYENDFGTVAIKTEAKDKKLKIIEVTTFRLEGKYTDKRHPDEVIFSKKIEDDLSRRDFTINAMAMSINDETLVDPFGGVKDLEKKQIRAVGVSEERFEEDALRLLRAVRLSSQLGFSIEIKTKKAVKEKASLLEFISKERIRDELTKLIMTDRAAEGIEVLQATGLLKYMIPELSEGFGVGQNKHHIFTVFEHNIKSLAYAVEKNFPFDIRIASLLHDVGKPKTKRGNGIDSTFYGHQVVGERMVLRIMDRLHFPKKVTEKVALLVREHMFVYDPESVTLAGVRRLLTRVGKDNIDDLFRVREADRIGSGVPKAQPYRLRHLKAMVEKVQKDPVHPKMIKLKGDAIMKILTIEPGPRIGWILSILLEEVLEDPNLNKIKPLTDRVHALDTLDDKKLKSLSGKAKQSAQEAQRRIDDDIKRKHFVK